MFRSFVAQAANVPSRFSVMPAPIRYRALPSKREGCVWSSCPRPSRMSAVEWFSHERRDRMRSTPITTNAIPTATNARCRAAPIAMNARPRTKNPAPTSETCSRVSTRDVSYVTVASGSPEIMEWPPNCSEGITLTGS